MTAPGIGEPVDDLGATEAALPGEVCLFIFGGIGMVEMAGKPVGEGAGLFGGSGACALGGDDGEGDVVFVGLLVQVAEIVVETVVESVVEGLLTYTVEVANDGSGRLKA